MPLNDAKCRSAKPGPKTRKLSDADGLQLWVRPSGSKSWYFSYRWKGRQTGFTLGVYPEMGLAEARARRDDARKLRRDGQNPRDHRPNQIAKTSVGLTFCDLAEQLIAKQRSEGLAEATLKKREWYVRHAKRHFGTKAPDDVTTFNVLEAARAFESNRNHETANRFAAFIAAVYRFGKAAAICKANPAGDLRGVLIRKKSVPRAAITDPKALGPLLRAIDAYQGDAVVLAALRLLPILFTRQSELRKARWSEFDWAKKEWTVDMLRRAWDNRVIGAGVDPEDVVEAATRIAFRHQQNKNKSATGWKMAG